MPGRDERPDRAAAYRALGLPPGAGPDAVARAYRLLARRLHPDAEGGNADAFDAVARARAVLDEQAAPRRGVPIPVRRAVRSEPPAEPPRAAREAPPRPPRGDGPRKVEIRTRRRG